MARERDSERARQRAAEHRRRAGELYAAHRRDGQDEQLAQAQRENSEAIRWEKTAEALDAGEKGGVTAKTAEERSPAAPASGDKAPEQDGFAKDGEAAPYTERRAWIEPGSVAAGDPLLQLEEAQAGSLMGELAKYAFRSVTDKEHRAFEGARLAGKAVTAPVKGVAKAGRVAAKGMETAARGTGAVARATSKGGRAILEAAARHKAKGRSPKTPAFGEQKQSAPAREKAGKTRSHKPAERARKTPQKTPRAKTRDRERER